ncbi:endolytic transglycosylase MltG [Actinocrinis puniceicyclus]|uniref:Endolytic transglycosylase MltG n=1 Tax=Actinocrinis puniceicyclus TaxID=977794 RepID=A0A8J8BCP1_9ACTN|nr:endolytic transglycosylase MltG [Actinocrinis puniceicyclus]MBS2963715.1 endolytic transglycosylase MltG [Actinocrinis puniceicyclus]
MSDDGWFGDLEEPAPPPGYAPGRGRRAASGREPQPGQSGQYPRQPGASGQYAQDQYQSNQYAQDYSVQPQASYYDELGPRSTPPHAWDSSQQQAYADSIGHQQPSYQQPSYEQQAYEPQSYEQPAYQEPYQSRQQYDQQQSYESQQPQRAQPQYGGQRGQAQRPAQPARPSSDPYASGSYASGSYGTDAYSSDPYSSGSYASGAYPSSSEPYSPGTQATDPYASGGYARPARRPNGASPGDSGASAVGSTSGGYTPTNGTRDPYSSGQYPVDRGGGGGRPAPGRGSANGLQTPGSAPTQVQDPYGRRRGSVESTGGYAQYEDDDEFPDSARTSRRASGYPGETDNRAEGAPRSRRHGVEADPLSRDEPDDDRFRLIDDDDDADDGEAGKGRKPKQKKGRNCLAVFLAFSVIAGGLGYGGYKGVQWYQSKYGAPPDYVSTTGTGAKVDVNIPSGAGGRTIGAKLFDAGVIKSQRAFTNACNAEPKCANIQAGTYLLPKGISAAAAVADLLDPKNQDSKSQLITYGGERAAQVFAALEAKTNWSDADIRAAIAGGKIDLPAWDTGQPGAKFPYAHIEGFIAAETYVLTDFKTPADLLKKMVDDQLAMFNQENMTAKAAALRLTPYKLLIIASLARAEAGSNTADLNKIAGVVFNRFSNPALFAHLGFDTSTLYGMGNTGTVPDNRDTANPYNTSVFGIKGLPPGPIDSPDQASIDAALNPNRANDYLYFCATPDGVQYAQNNTQWRSLGVKYKGLCGSG